MASAKIEPVVRLILGTSTKTIAAERIFIAKLFPSAVCEMKDLITTGSKDSAIEVDNKFATSTKSAPRLAINQAAAGITARFRIRIPSGNNLECSSRIRNPIPRSKPMSVTAERICKSLTNGVRKPITPPEL